MKNAVSKWAIDKKLQCTYRIRADRTPLLIRTPWSILWSFLATFCLKIIVVWDKKWPKMTMVGCLKIRKFNKTPVFYLPGYGIFKIEFIKEIKNLGNFT